MKILLLALIFAAVNSVSYANFVPKEHDALEGDMILSALQIGDVVSFRDPVTMCLHKDDFDKLVSVEKSGKDGTSLFLTLAGCDTLPLPHVILVKKLDEFQLHDGRKLWMVQVESLDHASTLFIGVPARYFDPADNP